MARRKRTKLRIEVGTLITDDTSLAWEASRHLGDLWASPRGLATVLRVRFLATGEFAILYLLREER